MDQTGPIKNLEILGTIDQELKQTWTLKDGSHIPGRALIETLLLSHEFSSTFTTT
jgi:hypothetical protein